jgi:hypothetical protein
MCYQCKRELTLKEVVEGQVALENADRGAEEEGWEFEGWVHCSGNQAMFIQPDDEELEEELRKVGAEFYPEGLIVCERCVEMQWMEERKMEMLAELRRRMEESSQ